MEEEKGKRNRRGGKENAKRKEESGGSKLTFIGTTRPETPSDMNF